MPKLGHLFLLCMLGMSPQLFAASEQSPVEVWDNLLKPRYFGTTSLAPAAGILELKTPYRAEDAAFTPVSVHALIPQTPARFIEKIHVFIDNNPQPLAGVFTLNPATGRADLALRVRVDNYTHVRAIAVLNTGEHYMAANFVKAQGGCSAPLASDYKAAMARIGEMNFRTLGKPAPDEALVGQLLLRHPNVTGMQKDQKTQLIRPAHFVKTVRLFYGDVLLMTAETGISISEDPSFRFFFKPREGAELRAEIEDSEGRTWQQAFKVEAPATIAPGEHS